MAKPRRNKFRSRKHRNSSKRNSSRINRSTSTFNLPRFQVIRQFTLFPQSAEAIVNSVSDWLDGLLEFGILFMKVLLLVLDKTVGSIAKPMSACQFIYIGIEDLMPNHMFTTPDSNGLMIPFSEAKTSRIDFVLTNTAPNSNLAGCFALAVVPVSYQEASDVKQAFPFPWGNFIYENAIAINPTMSTALGRNSIKKTIYLRGVNSSFQQLGSDSSTGTTGLPLCKVIIYYQDLSGLGKLDQLYSPEHVCLSLTVSAHITARGGWYSKIY